MVKRLRSTLHERFKPTLRGFFRVLQWPFPSPQAASVAIALSVVELMLLGFHGKSFWANGGLGIATQLGLAGLVLLWWMAVAWCAHWYLRICGRLVGRVRVGWGRAALKVALLAPGALAVCIYFTSWLFYHRLGVFPDLDALYFAGLNSGMLAKYFWQAERAAWLTYLAILSLVTVASLGAGFFLWRRVGTAEAAAPTFFRQALVVLIVINAGFISAEYSRRTGDPSQLPKDRIEAAKTPWAPFAFEFGYHVNPAITLFSAAVAGCERQLEGEIPLDALTPIGPIRPAHFPDVPPEKRRNIILITIESLRSDAILMKHEGREVMPNVAILARTGHFFPNCYANSTHSDYSDPCILSSLYPLRTTRHHFYRHEDPWPKVLIYDLLKQYGYATAMFSSQNETWSNMHLFYESPHLDLFFDSRSYSGKTMAPAGMNHWLNKTGQVAGKLDDAITIQRAIDWMRQQCLSRTPFFVSLNLQTSHFPYERPDAREHPFYPGRVPDDATLLSHSRDGRNAVRNAYFNALEYLDHQVGQLSQFLQSVRIRDQTIVAVIGDHGEAFFEDGASGHAGPPIEAVIRTGLVVNCPGMVRPDNDPFFAQAIDVVPTLLACLGLPHHPAHQGLNLLSPFRPANEDRLAFVHCSTGVSDCDAVVSATGWKMVFDNRRMSTRLYFVQKNRSDESELLAGYDDIARVLLRQLSSWRQRQLLYYQSPRYFEIFCAVPAPMISGTDRKLLVDKQPL
jgi:phosphoglycerol transferase MdoB-like AlkP superfamily enzyme